MRTKPFRKRQLDKSFNMKTKTKTLKLKAIKNVNIRKGDPQIKDDNLKGVIYKGQEFELEVEEIEDKVKCETIDGNCKWYKDANGDYLWSGGFEVKK